MAQIKADEITQLLREQIANYDSKVQVDEVGTITSLGDGIARLHGLDKVMAGELLSFPHGIAGLALSLEEDSGGRRDSGRLHRAEAKATRSSAPARFLSVPVGEA
jgi:F-type H+-transporting ATPase subunit alpha